MYHLGSVKDSNIVPQKTSIKGKEEKADNMKLKPTGGEEARRRAVARKEAARKRESKSWSGPFSLGLLKSCDDAVVHLLLPMLNEGKATLARIRHR